MHWLLVHSPGAPQDSPFALVARQAPPLQYGVGAAHCVSLVHAFAQSVPAALQAIGLHCTVLGAGQLPVPSHPAASVSVPCEQLALRHEVELPGYVQPSWFPAAHVPTQVAAATPPSPPPH